MDKFRELWANPRYKAIIKLGAWFVFLIIIVIFSAFSTNSNTSDITNDNKEEETVVFDSFDTMLNNLFAKDYKYTYKVANNTLNTLEVYNGEVKNFVETGYYESKEEIYKYSCSEVKCYKVFTDHQEEIQIASPVLTKLNNLFELVKEKTLTEKVDGETRSYSYTALTEDELKEVKITTSLKNITNIHVVALNETYEISFEH